MDGQQFTSSFPDDTRAAFFGAMSGLEAEFAAAAADIDKREESMRNALTDIRLMLHNGIGETVLAPSHPLARFMSDLNTDLANIVQDWLERIEKYDRNTAFRKGFTDSLVVFVLGKVKAGKSSLGNYMAYGRSNPDGAQIAGAQPYFFTAAMAQGEEGQTEAATGAGGYFRVGAGETTKSIQGFRVPGLTWVDSPGLHSVTPENGALASDYADVADLIIYPMHTSAPGRSGDVAEIGRLLRAKKRFLVAITQCDKLVQDEDADGTIVSVHMMKDTAARQGQIDAVYKAVKVAGDAGRFDILTMSVHYAETHDNSPDAIEESGVADFFRLLTEIARSEGVRRKRETPSRNLDHFVELITDAAATGESLSIVRVQARLRDLETRLAADAAELDRRANRVIGAVFERIGQLVTDQINFYYGDKSKTGFEQACTSGLREIVAEQIATEDLSLITAPAGSLPQVANFSKIPGFLEFEAFTLKVPKSNRKETRAVGGVAGTWAGTWAGAELGAIAGAPVPIIGPIIGGLIGATVGKFLGAAAGKALGSDWEESIQSGDNRAEVEASAVKALQASGQAAVEAFFANIKSAAISPVSKRAARLDHELARFSDILKRKVHSNGRSVPTSI